MYAASLILYSPSPLISPGSVIITGSVGLSVTGSVAGGMVAGSDSYGSNFRRERNARNLCRKIILPHTAVYRNPKFASGFCGGYTNRAKFGYAELNLLTQAKFCQRGKAKLNPLADLAVKGIPRQGITFMHYINTNGQRVLHSAILSARFFEIGKRLFKILQH